jgi:hypothetical protein
MIKACLIAWISLVNGGGIDISPIRHKPTPSEMADLALKFG